MKKYLFIVAIFSHLSMFSQNDLVLSEKIKELKMLFYDFGYQSFNFEDTSLFVIQEIAAIDDATNFPNRSIYLEKRAEQLKKDWGIDLYGGYVENFNLDPVADIEQNINYRRRVQMGVQWELIEGGLLENKLRSKIIQDRITREKLSNALEHENQLYLKRFDQTIYTFNALKLTLLEQRFEKLIKQHKIIRDLVYLKKQKKEDLIKVEIQLAEIESLITLYKGYNKLLAPNLDSIYFKKDNVTLINLNYETIFNWVGLQTDSLMNSTAYTAYYKWYHEIGVRPFARYSYYDVLDQATGDRSFFSAGINVTVPLSFDTKLKNEVEGEKWKYEQQRLLSDRSRTHEEVLNAVHEFRHQMKRFVDRFQRKKLLKEQLRIEKTKLKLSSLGGDPLAGLDLYNQLSDIDMELIDVLQNMYLKALKIQAKLPEASINDLIKSQSAEDFGNYSKAKKKGVYVWSSVFNQYSSDFLSEYAVYNEFDKLVVSVSDEKISAEKKAFLKFAAENKGEVYFMLGNNKLFYHEDITGYLQKVLNATSPIQPKGIHLDIEPHTFSDWALKKRDLLDKYVNMVAEVRTFCKSKGLKLEISVPKHYDQNSMDELFKSVDQVYFMCYENVDTDFLVRKLKGYVDKYPQKVIIALRTEDFNNRLEMENKIDDLQEKLGVNSFVYHDLKRLVEFDK